ncbi:Lipopolysaccharide ABC transporter, ATP-binding protein LptB [hydrothermal vent metagenome]|uniref:Lipopolysaccharide export system ATP-binding protein LptB n=1 Tax=hydrothermal vent metagenome TaxID=652676 RepID=A0A3B0ZDP6_9ZZZZ
MSSLIAKGIAKQYGDRQVVKNVSLRVDSGEVVGLLGPNGAGKTTSFYMVVGLVPCDKGEITLQGDDLTTLPLHARAKRGIGYLPQEASVFRKLSVADNIMAVLELDGDSSSSQRQQKLEALLQEFHLVPIRDSLGMSLSGGERRRVEIARALAADPKFILLDEPFAGVDPISVIDIQKIIQHLCQRGIGVLITDHNVRETLGICQRAYIMSAGEVLAAGTPQEILENQQVKDVYLGHGFKM